ncbi:MAG: hypothetical protein GPJ54_06450 [Candidatus Heimdallarchaeota archaeon]|nr:hypothetical protein [Candidatus Heimdallarchaeota archaeon]
MMEDPEVTSYDTQMEIITLRKNFSKYITKIEIELQQFGFQVPQSEILGYIMEKLTGTFFQRTKLMEEENIPIDASEEEIARYIINRKYPYMFKFDKENTKLNRLQRFMRDSRINNLSDKTSIWILRWSQSINLIFLLVALLLGAQSLYSLITVFANHEEISQSLSVLDGDLIYGYSLFWKPDIMLIMSVLFIVDLSQTYFVLNLPTLGRIMPKLNDSYNRTVLRTKIILTMGFSYVLYLTLGSVIIIREERINGYEPIQDLGIAFLTAFIALVLGGLIILQIRKEKISSLNHKRIRMRYRSVFYVINFLTLILSAVLILYLSLVIFSNADKAVNTTFDATSIEYDLTVLNFVTLILMSYYFIVFIISGLINHSHDKDNWIKFLNIQIIFQATLIAIYSIAQIWIISRFNSFMEVWDNDLRLDLSDLWQGMIRYSITFLVSIGILRLSK